MRRNPRSSALVDAPAAAPYAPPLRDEVMPDYGTMPGKDEFPEGSPPATPGQRKRPNMVFAKTVRRFPGGVVWRTRTRCRRLPLMPRRLVSKQARLDAFDPVTMRWAEELTPELRRRVVDETTIKRVGRGAYACRKGEPVDAWVGVMSGIVKLSSVSPDGHMVSFTGVPAGGWFGEGSLLKNEPRRYDSISLTDH